MQTKLFFNKDEMSILRSAIEQYEEGLKKEMAQDKNKAIERALEPALAEIEKVKLYVQTKETEISK